MTTKKTKKVKEEQIEEIKIDEPIEEIKIDEETKPKKRKQIKKEKTPILEEVKDEIVEEVKNEIVEEIKDEIAGEEKGKRFFKCFYDDNNILTEESDKTKLFGRFKGIRPRQAANKAFSSICKSLAKANIKVIGKEIIFSIIECSRKKKGLKAFNYIGKRETLDNKFEREVMTGAGDKKDKRKIIYKYKNNIHKYIIPELTE